MCAVFNRVFIVIRDDPALLSRSIDVLRTARPAHGELVVCEQRGATLDELWWRALNASSPICQSGAGGRGTSVEPLVSPTQDVRLSSPALNRPYICDYSSGWRAVQ